MLEKKLAGLTVLMIVSSHYLLSYLDQSDLKKSLKK